MKAVCAETQVVILAHQRKVFEEVLCNKILVKNFVVVLPHKKEEVVYNKCKVVGSCV